MWWLPLVRDSLKPKPSASATISAKRKFLGLVKAFRRSLFFFIEDFCQTTLDLLDRDRLGEVARLINVASAAHRDVVGEELERDDGQHRREQVGFL
jgi:hypothetical protein